jgi:2-polyprenyl-3-methyl-5-hydroxy-6-metoxy-1,4-benzoquinol methylase
MNSVEQYASFQRETYETHSLSREGAEAMVADSYAGARERADYQAQWIVNEHLRRREDITAPVDTSMRILDFGCGVGRVMEAIVDLGLENVDGVDISQAMLEHAAASPTLRNSRFWPTNGHDVGGAPENSYDLAYSLICLNHVSMRQTRIDIMRSLGRALKPGGTVVLEFLYYPSIQSSQIPLPHVPWNQNRTSVGTNSAADVWLTPDMLGELADDMRLAFRDIALHDIEPWDNIAEPSENETYPVRHNFLLATGTVGRQMAKRYFGPNPLLDAGTWSISSEG